MKSFKVLFVGSPGSGKTTAIRAISEVDVVDTDVSVSDSTIKRKRTTTVGMDYGKLSLGQDNTLHLYGTPGQERFRFMWDLMVTDMANDAAALVLLVDNTRNYPFKDIDYYLSEFWDYIVKRHFIIAVTRSDLKSEPDESDYLNQLKAKGIIAPIVFIDAREPLQVLDLVAQALSQESHQINWPEIREHVQTLAQNRENPAAEPEWIEKSRDVPDISVTDAAMQVRGILGATHMDAHYKINATSIEEGKYNELLHFLARISNTVEGKLPDNARISNLSLHGPYQDSLFLFREPDQSLGLLTVKSMTHSQIRQQANDLLQWSEHAEDTE